MGKKVKFFAKLSAESFKAQPTTKVMVELNYEKGVCASAKRI